MKYQVICHQHIFESERFFDQCHASTVEVLPDGTPVAAWFGGRHEMATDVAIWFSRCIGGEWIPPVRVADMEGIPCWNPVLFYHQDKLMLFYKVGHEIPKWQTMIITSEDGGVTWSKPKELVEGDFGGRGPVKNKPIHLKDGSILAPASMETVSYWTAFVDRSEDGVHWIRSESVPFDARTYSGMGMIQPTLWQDEKGTVHMFLRSTESAILSSESIDGGYSWSPARRTSLPNNNCGIDLVRMEDGRIVLVYNPVSGNWATRSPIAFSVSEDNGRTFSEPQILDYVPCDRNEERAEFSYPAIVSRNNDLYITYTWKRRTIAFWKIRMEPVVRPSAEEISNGVWVTMVTPFTRDGKEIDYPAVERLVNWYIEQGVDGLFAVCQSSEMFCLSREERRKLGRFVVEKAAGRVPVVVSGHVSNDLEDQIDELRDSRDSGAQAVVLVSNRLAGPEESGEGWAERAQKILNAIPNCVFGIYECPYPFKRPMSPELLRWCVGTRRFAFIKDTCCDLTQIKEKLKAISGSSIKLFNANSATLLESMRLGAAGFCGVMANFHPRLYLELTHNWKGNRQRAEMCQHFATVTSFCELQMYPICAKYHLNLCGVPMKLAARVKSDRDFTTLRKIETQALHQAYLEWEQYFLRG